MTDHRVKLAELLPVMGRLIHVAAPELEHAARVRMAELGDRLEIAEMVGRAGLVELGRVGDILRRARPRDPRP